MFSVWLQNVIVTVLLFGDILAGSVERNCDCIPLKHCMPFMKVIGKLEKPLNSQIVEFLRGKQCGFQEGYPRICCTELPINLLTDKQHSKKTCKHQRECVVLKNCQPFMDMINSMEKPLTTPVVDFLRSQECGFEHGFPKVCCSVLPKNFKVLKHARPETNRIPNKWNLQEIKTPVTIKPTARTSTHSPKKSPVMKTLKEKSDAINAAFSSSDLFDYTGTFDLMLRTKRFNGNLDIEIR